MSTPVSIAARVSPAEVEEAAHVFARVVHEHLSDGLAGGHLERMLSGLRILEHLVGLAGPTAAAAAWRKACRDGMD